MRGTRSRLRRLEQMDASDAIRRAVAVVVLPGDDEEEKIREACQRAGMERQFACLAIIRISSSGPDFEPPDSSATSVDG